MGYLPNPVVANDYSIITVNCYFTNCGYSSHLILSSAVAAVDVDSVAFRAVSF